MKTSSEDNLNSSVHDEASAHAPSPEQDGATPTSALLPALERIDPFLRFLTKATGKASVPLKLLRQVLPKTTDAAKQTERSTSGDASEKDDANGEGEGPLNEALLELTHRGVLRYNPVENTVGFPLPPSPSNSNDASASSSQPPAIRADMKPPSKLVGKGLHGSSDPSAKRRMKVLKWTLEKVPGWICRESADEKLAGEVGGSQLKKARGKRKRAANKSKADGKAGEELSESILESNNAAEGDEKQSPGEAIEEMDERNDACQERRAAYRALDDLLRGWGASKADDNTPKEGKGSISENDKQWLPCQAAYAGSHPGREARYGGLSEETRAKIPSELLKLFDLDVGSNSNGTASLPRKQKRLFLHQAKAIESAMNGTHTVVQTATGSGKSLCFLLPALAKALVSLQERRQRGDNSPGSAAILLFPTKALAQDQYTKISALLQSLPINAGVIDGDTPHAQRDAIASECQILLTNPDTLHAALLPNWRKRDAYKQLLARVSMVVVDEAHVYEGAFGAHVAMVLARLKRVCRVASSQSSSTGVAESSTAINPMFIACSATMIHAEFHFRQLCPIGINEEVSVLTSADDGSPCAAKHFFCWNPPILDINGNSTESVFLPKRRGNLDGGKDTMMGDKVGCDSGICTHSVDGEEQFVNIPVGSKKRKRKGSSRGSAAMDIAAPHHSNIIVRRRHAADETAFLLAKAIAAGVRTIAFCRTRMLVEWVYTKTLEILQSDPKTSNLTSQVESYRGGYTAEARRSIEERLFQNKLRGVVGTNALELGVDVGGVDLTLHTGYPGSISSLLQQSGRAGRGKGSQVPSCAIMVCFSSPSEQYIWKHPTSLLSKGVDVPPTLPINGTVMQGHLLCAGEEFPLAGNRPLTCLLNEFDSQGNCPTDCELLGPAEVYGENIDFLLQKRLLSKKTVTVASGESGDVESVAVYTTHPVVKSPWQRVSLRSIEPLSYSIVDLSHNMQGGKTDKIHNQAAVLDTIPYSRIFYHAFPGAIIMHRGRKYRIESMESPPPFVGGSSFGPSGCSNLLAFAKPTTLQYTTQALSINQITVVKQLGHAESLTDDRASSLLEPSNEGKCVAEEKKEEARPNKNSVASTVAGHGTVTVKRTVHGYKKLSHVNRKELSRTTISLPPMEYDTHALWIPVPDLRDVCLNFDGGVHALSHALVAVAPVYVSCTSADIDCDHSRFDCTRILLYDQRAGGSGVTAELYNFVPEALQAAVELLEDCSSCYSAKGYDGGCPACLQSVMCDNFHQDLSRSTGIQIGKYLIERLQGSSLRSQMSSGAGESQRGKLQSSVKPSSVKPKNILIGRAGWMESKERSRWADVDE
ncbi:hypothetical protein ACHAXT_004354 [Thalassiosira profunda]